MYAAQQKAALDWFASPTGMQSQGILGTDASSLGLTTGKFHTQQDIINAMSAQGYVLDEHGKTALKSDNDMHWGISLRFKKADGEAEVGKPHTRTIEFFPNDDASGMFMELPIQNKLEFIPQREFNMSVIEGYKYGLDETAVPKTLTHPYNGSTYQFKHKYKGGRTSAEGNVTQNLNTSNKERTYAGTEVTYTDA